MNSPLMAALQQFDISEANLGKLERLWDEIRSLIPQGVVFGENAEYEDRCRSFAEVLGALPPIEGWKPVISLPDLNEIAQNRFDAMDLGEIEVTISVETAIAAPGSDLREYRFRFNQKRRALIRDTLVNLIDSIDADLRTVWQSTGEMQPFEKICSLHWDNLRERVAQIDVLLGSAPRPPRWSEMRRHLGFGQHQDLIDIEKLDWPRVKAGLRKDLYGDNEPLPSSVRDLGDLVAAKPRGEVVTKLAWSNLDKESFERLLFNLISTTKGYENPEWLTRTDAPDRGRDLSVMRVIVDQLAGTQRQRVIIQCRHWLSASITLPDVVTIKEQMSLWGQPRVEVVTITTSGRFTTDAIQWIETHNASGNTPSIEMWPESHLERLLASRPDIVAAFGLR
jgi:Restriction endonuclease